MKKLLTFLTLLTLSIGVGWAAEAVDHLVRSITGVTAGSSDYTTWSGKTCDGGSSAVFAGCSAGGNDAIQIRSSGNNSGIVTTTSGGKITKVRVNWNSNTADTRTLNIYGSNSAYTAASNLYSTSTQGTLLGTIVKGTSTELEISGDYAYIGVRSASGAMYIGDIWFTWETDGGTPQPTTYSITGTGATTGGTVSATATSGITSGTSVTLTATPNSGYELTAFTVNGTDVFDNMTGPDTNGAYTYDITVTDNVTVSANFTEQSTPPSGDYLFYESFDKCGGSGGNDNQWSGSIAGTEITSTDLDNTGWDISKTSSSSNTTAKVFAGDKCVRTGHNTIFTTPSINVTDGQIYTLTFKAAAWNTNSESTNLKLYCDGGTLSSSTETLVKGQWTEYTITVTATASSLTIGFGGNGASNSRFFLDEVKIEAPEVVEKTYNVTVTQATGGTITASPVGEKVVDAGDKITVTATPATGYEFTSWSITGAEETEPDANNEITAAGNVTITATFSPRTLNITRTIKTNGNVSDAGGWVGSWGDNCTVGTDWATNPNYSVTTTVGKEVTFMVGTNNNYQMVQGNVTAVDENGDPVTLTSTWQPNNDGQISFSFIMPSGDVAITANFTDYRGELRLAGHFNGNSTWRTGTAGPAFTYDSSSDTYTIKAYFTGIDDSGYNDYFFLTLDGEEKHPKADQGNYYISDLNGGSMPFELSGSNSNNFGCAPGLFDIEINGALTSMKFTKVTPTISFTPPTGEVEQGTSVSATSNIETHVSAVKAIDSDAVGDVTVGVNTDNGNTWDPSVTLSTIGSATVYGKSWLSSNSNINATGSATYNVVAANTNTQYQLITSTDDLVANKKYIIVSETKGKAAGAMDGVYLSENSITIDLNSHIATVNDNVEVFTLGGNATDGWTLTNKNGEVLGAKAAKSLTYDENDDPVTTATISFGTQTLNDNITYNKAEITYGSYGRIIHNVNSPRFLNYTSDYTVSMLPVQLYKQVEGTVIPTCATPTFSPVAGEYTEAQSVTISCATDGATIYYSTNGTDFQEYTEAINVSESIILYAYATCEGYTQSQTAEAEYTITTPKVATPEFDPGEGIYTSAQNVTITCATAGATIYYSTDGETYTEYTASIPVSEETTLYAKATLTGYIDSDIAQATYSFAEAASDKFVLVTSDDQIVAGGEYIIVSHDYQYVMGIIGGNDYGAKVEGSVFNDDHTEVTPATGANILTLEGSAGAWNLKQKNNNYIWLQKGGTNIYSKASTYSNTDYSKSLIIEPQSEDNTIRITTGSSSTRRIGFYDGSKPFGHWADNNYNQANTQYHKVYLYYRNPSVIESKTLAQIISLGENAEGKTYKISNADGLLGVHKIGTSIWFKDEEQAVDYQNPTAAEYKYYTVVEPTLEINKSEKDFAQNNWIEVVFPAAKDFTNAYVKNLTGTYSCDNGNPKLTLTVAVDEDNDVFEVPSSGLAYELNPYIPANFAGNQEYTNNGETQTFFFSTPKAQEYAQILWAVWDGEKFNMTTDNDYNYYGFKGSFTINPELNSYPTSGLTSGDTYNFKAIIRKNISKAGPYEVYPTDLNPEVPTAINGVVVNGLVKSVKYVNVAGMVSDVPFQGINIVVTEYTDGTRTTTKMLRK